MDAGNKLPINKSSFDQRRFFTTYNVTVCLFYNV